MLSSIQALPEFFFSAYSADEVYAQSQVIDLNAECETYSLSRHHPELMDEVSSVFDATVSHGGRQLTAAELLQAEIFAAGDEQLFEDLGFQFVHPDPETGVVLKHDSLEGWLIKKNYGWAIDEYGDKKRITKAVGAKDLPRWMLPPALRDQPKEKMLGIQIANDSLNPLRVAVLKRGRQWIRSLGLKNLKAAKEYLHVFPESLSADPKPLHERSVVFSKKEDLMSEYSSMNRFVQLAETHPHKLKEIAEQVCLFTTCNPITDLHLNNMRFLNDDTDTLFFMDGEPIGGLAEASDAQTIEANNDYDRGFFPILALRNLQAMIPKQMQRKSIPTSDIEKVQEIFNAAIDKRVQVIIWEREWMWLKSAALSYIPGLSLLTRMIAAIQRAFQGLYAWGQAQS